MTKYQQYRRAARELESIAEFIANSSHSVCTFGIAPGIRLTLDKKTGCFRVLKD